MTGVGPGTQSAIWLFDLERGSSERLTADDGIAYRPSRSKDGADLFFTVGDAIRRRSERGSGSEATLLDTRGCSEDVSTDGRFLIYSRRTAGKGLDLWMAPVTGNGKPSELVATRADEFQAQLSPDGRWLAHVAIESGKSEVYVQPFPPTGARWLISTAGGFSPGGGETEGALLSRSGRHADGRRRRARRLALRAGPSQAAVRDPLRAPRTAPERLCRGGRWPALPVHAVRRAEHPTADHGRAQLGSGASGVEPARYSGVVMSSQADLRRRVPSVDEVLRDPRRCDPWRRDMGARRCCATCARPSTRRG